MLSSIYYLISGKKNDKKALHARINQRRIVRHNAAKVKAVYDWNEINTDTKG